MHCSRVLDKLKILIIFILQKIKNNDIDGMIR